MNVFDYIKIKNIMKTIKTYSIDKSIYDKFDNLTKELNLNKSSFIQEKISDFVNENSKEFPLYIDEINDLIKTNPYDFSAQFIYTFQYNTTYSVRGKHMIDIEKDGYSISDILSKLESSEKLEFCLTQKHSIYWNRLSGKYIRISSDKGSIDKWLNKIDDNHMISGQFSSFPYNCVKEWKFRIQEKQFKDRTEFHPLFYMEIDHRGTTEKDWYPLMKVWMKNLLDITHFETIEEAQKFIDDFKEEEDKKVLVKEVFHEI